MSDTDTVEVPIVSGISPKEGPPGTKLTIRGEHLGDGRTDIIDITINGKSCLESLEYTSSKKVACLTPSVAGSGLIIITTLSGGRGSCNVSFTGLEAETAHVLEPLEESSVWVEEDFQQLTPGFSQLSQTPAYTWKNVDPLGISSDEAKSRRSRKPSSIDNLEKLFPNGSGEILSEKFNPVWYLLEKHRFTSFNDLKLGLGRLHHEVTKSDQAPVQFMRDNLDAFLQCYDTLSDVNELLIRNESESQGGSLTDRVEELLKELAKQAESLFEGVLKCKSRADATRNALTVLQRYRFLFSLPHSIERNITNGEYDLVTTDYERAKSLFSGTQVKVFKKVLEEVEKQIKKFCEDLRKQQVLPSHLDEQKKIIKYLMELDLEGDPAWDCISHMHHWLIRVLFSSKDEFQGSSSGDQTPQVAGHAQEHEAPPTVPPRIRGHDRTMSDVSYSSTGSFGSQSTAPSVAPTPKLQPQETKTQREWGSGPREAGGRPNRILFVEDLTQIVTESLQDFWRLGQAYFTGSLFQGVSFLDEQQQQRLAKNCEVNHPKFETMVVEITEVYTDMVNCSLFVDAYESLSKTQQDRLGEWVPFDDPLLESSGDWLPHIVRLIRECVGSLQILSLPEKAVNKMQVLVFNVRTLCADTLFHRAARDIEVLHEREDWRVHAEESGIVTSLPILFENLVVGVLLTLKEIVVETSSEEVDEEMNQRLLNSSMDHFHGLLEHFTSCFDYLAFHQEDDLHQESIHLISQGRGLSEEVEIKTPHSDERLLMTMSNLSYVKEQVIPRLFDCFVSHGYPQCPHVLKAIVEQIDELDEKVFVEYIKRKSESLLGIIEQGMHMGYFDWENCWEPQEVRGYVKELLLNLVLFHAEVYAVSTVIVDRVLYKLVELVSEEFFRLLREIKEFSFSGKLYAKTEVLAFEQSVKLYVSPTARQNFHMCSVMVGKVDEEGMEIVGELAQDFLKRTTLQLRCFTPEMDFATKSDFEYSVTF